MNKLFITIGFILMVAAQWWVPGKMIYDQETVLTQGTPYKFKVQPIDPHDPFRGKYITLNYEEERNTLRDSTLVHGQQVYAYIEEGVDGYAKVTQLSSERLDIDQDYVLADYRGRFFRNSSISFPFNRFYMEESKAYSAEVAVRRNSRRGDSLSPVCYALVYVKEDVALVENVFIGETSIKEFVEAEE